MDWRSKEATEKIEKSFLAELDKKLIYPNQYPWIGI